MSGYQNSRIYDDDYNDKVYKLVLPQETVVKYLDDVITENQKSEEYAVFLKDLLASNINLKNKEDVKKEIMKPYYLKYLENIAKTIKKTADDLNTTDLYINYTNWNNHYFLFPVIVSTIEWILNGKKNYRDQIYKDDDFDDENENSDNDGSLNENGDDDEDYDNDEIENYENEIDQGEEDDEENDEENLENSDEEKSEDDEDDYFEKIDDNEKKSQFVSAPAVSLETKMNKVPTKSSQVVSEKPKDIFGPKISYTLQKTEIILPDILYSIHLQSPSILEKKIQYVPRTNYIKPVYEADDKKKNEKTDQNFASMKKINVREGYTRHVFEMDMGVDKRGETKTMIISHYTLVK